MFDMVPDDTDLMGRGFIPKIRTAVKRIAAARKKQRRPLAAAAGARLQPRIKVASMVKRATGAPATMRRIKGMVRSAALMGVDFNDDAMMGTWFRDIAQKIKGAVQNVKNIQLTTGQGTAQAGQGGVTWTDQVESVPAASPMTSSITGGMQNLLKNPLFIGAGLSLAAFMMSRKKRGRK